MMENKLNPTCPLDVSRIMMKYSLLEIRGVRGVYVDSA